VIRFVGGFRLVCCDEKGCAAVSPHRIARVRSQRTALHKDGWSFPVVEGARRDRCPAHGARKRALAELVGQPTPAQRPKLETVWREKAEPWAGGQRRHYRVTAVGSMKGYKEDMVTLHWTRGGGALKRYERHMRLAPLSAFWTRFEPALVF
jgi:hypothetical protein